MLTHRSNFYVLVLQTCVPFIFVGNRENRLSPFFIFGMLPILYRVIENYSYLLNKKIKKRRNDNWRIFLYQKNTTKCIIYKSIWVRVFFFSSFVSSWFMYLHLLSINLILWEISVLNYQCLNPWLKIKANTYLFIYLFSQSW